MSTSTLVAAVVPNEFLFRSSFLKSPCFVTHSQPAPAFNQRRPYSRIFCSKRDDKIDSKCHVYRSYGWADSDILLLIRRHPECLGHSEAGMRKKLDFYMNELGYDPAYLASRCTLLGFSLKNRVLPRHRVLLILKEKGLIEADYQLLSAVKLTEDEFLNKYVLPYDEKLNLRDVYFNRGSSS